MKKYLLAVASFLFLLLVAPMKLDAASLPDTLTAGDMAKAQEIAVNNEVAVDLSVEDYKLYKITLPADRVCTLVETMAEADREGSVSYCYYPPYTYYDDEDKETYESRYAWPGRDFEYYAGKVMYVGVWGDGTSAFSVKDLEFTDNVNQRSDKGTTFNFRPRMTGTYSFKVDCKDSKGVWVELSNAPNVTEDLKVEEAEGDYTHTVTATLEAGKNYVVGVYNVSGKYSLSLVKSPASDAVAAQINGMNASGESINATGAAYDALLPSEKKLVSNHNVLEAAQTAYAEAMKPPAPVVNTTKPSVAKVKMKSAKPAKKKTVLVKWKKVSGANGYQVAYSMKKNFKKAKSVNVAGKKSKAVLKKLKRGKKYYVKVRAWKNYNGQKAYGKFSKVAKVVCK
ncbi:MAG: fibronectin type III domain-containing protein [Eubacteriales bacterium]|nr:fibronectin type III domain-containing protein [Eubacteriales bacterium]